MNHEQHVTILEILEFNNLVSSKYFIPITIPGSNRRLINLSRSTMYMYIAKYILYSGVVGGGDGQMTTLR